jgi:PleD family two-component response regulator
LNLGIEHDDSPPLRKTTISIGVAIVWPTLKRTPQGMIQLADEALYAAKHGGRNCVIVREDEASGQSTGKFRVPGAEVG